MYFTQKIFIDTPSITAKLISEQKDDKEKKTMKKKKVKAENGFQDNYSVVVKLRYDFFIYNLDVGFYKA